MMAEYSGYDGLGEIAHQMEGCIQGSTGLSAIMFFAWANLEIVMGYKTSASNICMPKAWRGINTDEDVGEAWDGGVDWEKRISTSHHIRLNEFNSHSRFILPLALTGFPQGSADVGLVECIEGTLAQL